MQNYWKKALTHTNIPSQLHKTKHNLALNSKIILTLNTLLKQVGKKKKDTLIVSE